MNNVLGKTKQFPPYLSYSYINLSWGIWLRFLLVCWPSKTIAFFQQNLPDLCCIAAGHNGRKTFLKLHLNFRISKDQEFKSYLVKSQNLSTQMINQFKKSRNLVIMPMQFRILSFLKWPFVLRAQNYDCKIIFLRLWCAIVVARPAALLYQLGLPAHMCLT